MAVNGEQLRNLRIEKGYSQEKLAIMSNVNRRTIQRAESGKPIAIETVAFIAEALEVPPVTIRSSQSELFEDTEKPQPVQKGEVILVPTMSGRRLIDLVRTSYSTEILCEVEPRKDKVDLLSNIATLLESVSNDPWCTPLGQNGFPGSQILSKQAEANDQLEELKKCGSRIFIVSYQSRAQIPRYGEEGMYVNISQKEEKVSLSMVIISDTNSGHISRIQKDHEDTISDDIPF